MDEDATPGPVERGHLVPSMELPGKKHKGRLTPAEAGLGEMPPEMKGVEKPGTPCPSLQGICSDVTLGHQRGGLPSPSLNPGWPLLFLKRRGAQIFLHQAR